MRDGKERAENWTQGEGEKLQKHKNKMAFTVVIIMGLHIATVYLVGSSKGKTWAPDLGLPRSWQQWVFKLCLWNKLAGFYYYKLAGQQCVDQKVKKK